MGATARQVDFSGVKDGGNFNRNRIPAGDYLAIITKVEDAKAKDGIDQYLFSIKIKNRPSSVFPHYCKLQENQLWKLRNLFIAAGKTVPKKRLKVDPNQIVGKLIGVTIEDDEYQDKEQSQISGVFPAAELGDDENLTDDDASVDPDGGDEDEDDSDIAAPVSVDEDEDEAEDEEPEADELAGLSRNELKERIRALQDDFVVKKSMTDDDLRDILSKMIAADSDDEEEEETQPKQAAKKKTKAPEPTEDEDLDELDIDDL